MILDIYSRSVVGWLLAHRESTTLAKELIETTIKREGISEDQLIIHSDRGPSMTSHGVAHLLSSLGVTKSHSRPHVSNDNPFSESQFKTMKYRPEFPKRFGSFEDARQHCKNFMDWYNHEHYHSGIGMVTPASLHDGSAREIVSKRARTLKKAWAKMPERFVHGTPKPQRLPKAVWINPPVSDTKKAPEASASDNTKASGPASLTHPRSGYPSDGCVPAEPPSVSPDVDTLPQPNSLNTRDMPQKIPGARGLAPDILNTRA